MFIASSLAGTMLQCLACKHRGGMLKKISVPFTLREKNPGNVSINISWCKTPNSTFWALYISKMEN